MNAVYSPGTHFSALQNYALSPPPYHFGFNLVRKVHILGFLFCHSQAKSHAFIHFAFYDVVDVFFLPLIQCCSADAQNGRHKKSHFCHKQQALLQYVVNESHFLKRLSINIFFGACSNLVKET